MATLKEVGFLNSSPYLPTLGYLRSGTRTKASLNIPNSRKRNISLSNLSTKGLVEELDLGRGFGGSIIEEHAISINDVTAGSDSSLVMEKLYLILEQVVDRMEMHKNIKEQRDNWNTLLLTSVNGITLAAATMSGVAATASVVGAPISALKISSTLLYLTATGILVIMNKIQPCQLAEEQRNAVRLFKQLQIEIQRMINLGNPTDRDVNEVLEKVLCLDKAYPLPLLGVMLDKFPNAIEPAVWWRPQQRPREGKEFDENNGWNGIIEKEMKEIVEVIRRKDKAEYLRLGEEALKMNKFLSITGPLLTGIGALGSAFVGCSSSSSSYGFWAAILGVVCGSLASVVNTFEHGGQVGMVFEMYRSNAGFFKLMEETIESNLREEEIQRRENGELLELKIALQLGRSLSELRNLSSSNQEQDIDEFASKLF